MTRAKIQKTSSERGPLLALFVLFADSTAAAELFQTMRWHGRLFCSACGLNNIAKDCSCQGRLQWYTGMDCYKTFDKTCTVLYYQHISLDNWIATLWLYKCGLPNGVSARFIIQATGSAYKTTYYMMRSVMERICGLTEKSLKDTYETDEAYVKASFKEVQPDTSGEGRTIPNCRDLPHGLARSKFEKSRPMVAIYFQQATDDESDVEIMGVQCSNGSKTLADIVQEQIESDFTVVADEHTAYKSLKEWWYDCHPVNHSESEYAFSKRNKIHTNNCECRIDPLKRWLKKYHGVSKWYLPFYVKSFQLVYTQFHNVLNGRFVATLATVLVQFENRQVDHITRHVDIWSTVEHFDTINRQSVGKAVCATISDIPNIWNRSKYNRTILRTKNLTDVIAYAKDEECVEK